jgi:hypothetical protein
MNEAPLTSPVSEDDFVEAELLPDVRSPFAFGMRAMFGLTAIAAVQFALMAYLGMLAGLLIGVVVCCVAIGGVMIFSIVSGVKPDTSLMERLDRVAIRLVFGVILLFFGTMIAGGGQILYTVIENYRFTARMQDELGFTYKQQTMWDGSQVKNVLVVTKITPGGPFDQAGVLRDDVILTDNTPHEFLQAFDENRGQTVDVNVATLAAQSNGTLANAPTRVVTVAVPQ